MIKLSKYIQFVVFSSSIYSNVACQNLVPNPSFEEFVNFDIINVKGWHKVQNSDTPDYINIGTSNSFNNIYDKYLGGAKPKVGNAYLGIFCYRVNSQRNIKNIREFIETPLISSLEKDSLYRIEFSVSLDAESNRAIKNMGIYFSQNSILSTKDINLFKIKPQIEFNSTYLDSTNNWITLYSLYKATGGENFVSLGNFRVDNTTTIEKVIPKKDRGKMKKWNLSPTEKSSYYYIDDVIIEKTKLNQHALMIDTIDTSVRKDSFNIDQIKVDSAVILKTINFDFNKSDLLPESYNELNKLFRLLLSNMNVRIKLEGHTDNIGSYEFNLQLSLKRAESVANYLIENGINPSRIEYNGYSYLFPLVSNNTDDGRKLNRRVVFRIIEK